MQNRQNRESLVDAIIRSADKLRSCDFNHLKDVKAGPECRKRPAGVLLVKKRFRDATKSDYLFDL